MSSTTLFESTDYKYGFSTNVDTETFAKGLGIEVIEALSKMRNEPEWLLEFCIKAYKKFLKEKKFKLSVPFLPGERGLIWPVVVTCLRTK